MASPALTASVPEHYLRFELPGDRVMQSFAQDPTTGQWYVSRVSTARDSSVEDTRIFRCDPNGKILDYAVLAGGGHGSTTAVQVDEDGVVWLWLWWRTNTTSGDYPNRCVRWRYRGDPNGVTIYRDDADIDQLPDLWGDKYVCYSLDPGSDTLAVRVRDNTPKIPQGHIEKRSAAAYLAGTDEVLASRGTWDLDWKAVYQGHVATADRLYRYQGNEILGYPLTLRSYAWGDEADEDQLDVTALGAGTVGGWNEAEGVALTPDGSLLFGVVTGGRLERQADVYTLVPGTVQPGTQFYKNLVLDVHAITGAPFDGAVVELSYDRTVRLRGGGMVPPIAAEPVQIATGTESVAVLPSDAEDLTTDSRGFGINVRITWTHQDGRPRSQTYVAQLLAAGPDRVNLSSRIGAQPVPQEYANATEVLDIASEARDAATEARNAAETAAASVDSSVEAAQQAATQANASAESADSAAQAAAESAALVEAPAGDVIDAHLGGDSTGMVEQVAGKVDKGEIVVNVADHGADPTGTVSSSQAINSVLGAGHGHALITNGTFLIDATINMSTTNQRLTIDESATLVVADGFVGDVIRFGGSGSIRGAVVDGGGLIVAQGKSGGSAIEPGNWTGVRFKGDNGAGTTACQFDGPQMNWPGTAFAWEVGTTGWVNGCIVAKCRVLYPRILVDIINPGTNTGFTSNTVTDIMGQSGQYTTHGIRGLTGSNWNLIAVSPWDLPGAAVPCHVKDTAAGINIIGGLLTGNGFINEAADGEVAILDGSSLRPWQRPEMFRSNEFFPDSSAGTPCVMRTYQQWPVMSYAAGATAQADTFWTCPPMVSRISVALQLVGLDAASGTTYFLTKTQAGIGGAETTRIFQPTISQDQIVNTPDSDTFNVTPGTTYRLRATRMGATAIDTVQGAVGLIAVTIKYIA